MSSLDLALAIQGIPSLRGVFVTALPECLLFDALLSEEHQDTKSVEEVAMLFGELLQTNQRTLQLLGAQQPHAQLLVEHQEMLFCIRPLPFQFALGIIYEPDVPLGLVRVFASQIAGHITSQLEDIARQAGSRGGVLLDYALGHLPEPSTVLRRLSLRTGIPMDTLHQPALLSEKETELLEGAVCDILGVEHIELAS